MVVAPHQIAILSSISGALILESDYFELFFYKMTKEKLHISEKNQMSNEFNTVSGEDELPPPYGEHLDHRDDSPPEYDDEKRPPIDHDSKGKKSVPGQNSHNPLPVTALHLLGLDIDDARRKFVESFGREAPDPAIFEFELTCLQCFAYVPECRCPGGGHTRYDTPWQLAEYVKNANPEKSFTYPPTLSDRIGEKTAQLSALIAHGLWPAIVRGMIPIFSHDCLVVLRSRALDRATDPKEVLVKMQNAFWTPIKEFENTSLRDMPEDKATRSYMSILPKPSPYLKSSLPKHARGLSWDKVLDSLLNEVLSCDSFVRDRYEIVPTETILARGSLMRAVLRSENFGVSPGFLVVEFKNDGFERYKVMKWGHSLVKSEEINSARVVRKGGFMASDSKYQPQPGELATSTSSAGWTGLSLDASARTKDAHYLRLKKGRGLFPQRVVLGRWKRPLPGKNCSGRCQEAKGRIKANFAGFAPPLTDLQRSTVYNLGSDPLPWLVVAQYASEHPKPLFFVAHEECTGCTILEAPQGSIIAAKLPQLMNL
jgi:hypothetical protein